MTEQYVGQINIFGFNFAPTGWQPCNGQILPINQYSAVFALLGTTYGGNGVQTFALPDLRSRTSMALVRTIRSGRSPGRRTTRCSSTKCRCTITR
jgi:microcystin-dependent protein